MLPALIEQEQQRTRPEQRGHRLAVLTRCRGKAGDTGEIPAQHARILLVDLTQSDLPLSDINELAEVCEPGVTVVAIGDRNDVGLFRELMN